MCPWCDNEHRDGKPYTTKYGYDNHVEDCEKDYVADESDVEEDEVEEEEEYVAEFEEAEEEEEPEEEEIVEESDGTLYEIWLLNRQTDLFERVWATYDFAKAKTKLEGYKRQYSDFYLRINW